MGNLCRRSAVAPKACFKTYLLLYGLGGLRSLRLNMSMMMTGDNVICEVNPFAQRLTGYRRSELVGRSLVDFSASSGANINDAIDALSQTGTYGVVIARDIFDRVATERRLRETQDHLEQRVTGLCHLLKALKRHGDAKVGHLD